MNIIGIFLLCFISFCLGLQKGKDPHFFRHILKKAPKKESEKGKTDKKKRSKQPAEKVVSLQQYKENRK